MATPEESVVHGSAATPPPLEKAVTPQQLPALDRLLRQPDVVALATQHGKTLVTAQARQLLERLREQALAGALLPSQLAPARLHAALAQRIDEQLRLQLRPVLNLSGTVLHTNLGRARLPEAALQHMRDIAGGATNLEYDLATGERGDRDSLIEGLLCQLTGAQAATVVNNNAAAVLLTLAALGQGREVVVSRGELVEIGGSFRLPEVMQSAGARLVEVGATNRTHLYDYEQAITAQTALLMKVHTSNYRIEGFTASVDEAALSQLARARALPLVSDLGSGALVDLAAWGLPPEPTPQQMLQAGCDIVTFSGDKLLGGPQAGFIVGRSDLIARIRRHPMKRALRVGKLLLAALDATLRLYLRPERLAAELPTLRLLARPLADIDATAREVLAPLQARLAPAFTAGIVPLQSQIGSGSLPTQRLASRGIAIAPGTSQGSGRALLGLARALRMLPVPVIGRIHDNALLLDLRCLEDAGALTTQLAVLQLDAAP
ncbi:MAG: L-seryl-tRNA(Sec) selenium transferase [Ottowia sp.]|nr:L-seryl-tRNA(Sec) selenium transferase [Ottowia sp.]